MKTSVKGRKENQGNESPFKSPAGKLTKDGGVSTSQIPVITQPNFEMSNTQEQILKELNMIRVGQEKLQKTQAEILDRVKEVETEVQALKTETQTLKEQQKNTLKKWRNSKLKW